MTFQRVSANDIDLKYQPSEFDLVWDYLGPHSSRGEQYYDSSIYTWWECIEDMKPIAVFCLAENMFLERSMHLSVLEVCRDYRNNGKGAAIMHRLIDYAKQLGYLSITLQAHNDQAASFYAKLGFSKSKVNDCPIMRLFICF